MKRVFLLSVLYCVLVSANEKEWILKDAELECQRGNVEICQELADAYGSFFGFYISKYGEVAVARDNAKSRKFYEKACEGNMYESCYKLAVDYHVGTGGVKKDLKRAIALYDKACDAGLVGGCQLIAMIYLSGGEGLKQDINKGEAYHKKACDFGDYVACATFAAYYEKNGKIKKASEYYKQSCDLSKAHSRALGEPQTEDMQKYCDRAKKLK